MFRRTVFAPAVILALASTLLVACGVPASASPPPPPPTFPAPPPLDPAAEAARTPEPTPPPAPTAAVAPLAAALLVDSFDDPQLTGWTPTPFFDRGVGVRWEARKGELRQAGDDSGSPGGDAAYLVAGDPAWRDYTVEVAAYAGAETDLGLVARYGEQGFYRARLAVGEQRSELILTVVGASGEYRELGRASVGGTLGRWVRLRLDLQDTDLTLTLDDGPSVRASDDTFSSGKVGLFARSDTVARFDNLVVSAH